MSMLQTPVIPDTEQEVVYLVVSCFSFVHLGRTRTLAVITKRAAGQEGTTRILVMPTKHPPTCEQGRGRNIDFRQCTTKSYLENRFDLMP